jgi:hypothetical protein
MFLALELCLSAICLLLAYIYPQIANSCFTRVETRFSTFAKKRALAVVSAGLLALGLRLALLPILPIPQPKVQDEFSYLLLSDTLAHGRLANPPHPMWVHFETFHVNWHPTYASMYYPGYGLFLAFGQAVLGHPFWGVWLSSGLMCAAICWALQGWMPPGWALLGSVLAVIRLGLFSYWADSYWGGTVTALGGSLALGALPRLKEQHRVRNSILLAAGMALLAATRPYEGLFYCVPILCALFFWALRKDSLSRKDLSEIVWPVALVLAVALCALGYYFWRVTGSPFTIPYQLNMRTYGLIYFPWDKIRPVRFNHAAMQMFYRGGAVLGFYDLARSHPLRLQFAKALVLWLFYFGPLFSMAWLVWLFSRPWGIFWKSFTPQLRFLLTLCLATYLSIMLTIHLGQPHYAASLTAAFYAITLLLLRDLYGPTSLKSVTPGRFIARSIPVICVVLLMARTAAPLFHANPKPSWIRTWCSQDEQNLERARILKQLENMPGCQLAIVRYQPNHDFILDEWVYNRADIDGSKVVWARDMGPRNSELLQYFSSRHVWLVEPDYNPARLSPYVH